MTHTYQLAPKSIEFCNFWQGQVNSFFNFELEFLLFLNLFLLNISSTNELEDLLVQLFPFFSALFLEHFLQLRLLLSIALNSMDKKKPLKQVKKIMHDSHQAPLICLPQFSVNECGSRKFYFYLNSKRKIRSYVEEGLGVFPISPCSSPPWVLLLLNILSGEEWGETAVFAGYGIAIFA